MTTEEIQALAAAIAEAVVQTGDKRDSKDIGTDEAYTCNLKNVVDTHFNIGTQALQTTQTTLDAAVKQQATELATINAATIQHMKDVNALTLNAAQLAIDRQWNVDEQSHVVASILASPYGPAIKAKVAADDIETQPAA